MKTEKSINLDNYTNKHTNTKKTMRKKFMSVISICLGFIILIYFCVFVSAIIYTALFSPPTPENNGIATPGLRVNISSGLGGDSFIFLDLNSSLSTWLRMEPYNSTLFPSLSGRDNLTCSSTACPSVVTGLWGNAIKLDGVNDYVIASEKYSNFNVTDGITFSFWANASSTTTSRILYHYTNATNAFQIGTLGGGSNAIFITLRYNTSTYEIGGAADTACAIEQNNWTHFVITFNGTASGIVYYKNGAKVTAACGGGLGAGFTVTTGELWIGGRGASNSMYNGSVDEVMIFQRVLTANEIKSLYNATANKYDHSFTNLQNGTYSLLGYAENISGDMSVTDQRNITYASGEIAVFSVSNFSKYPYYWVNQGKTLPMNITCTNTSGQAGTLFYSFKVDNTDKQSGTTNIFNFTASDYSVGVHNVTATCDDGFAQASAIFKVEVLNPNAFLVVQVPDAHVTDTVIFNLYNNTLNESMAYLAFLSPYVNISFVASTGDNTDNNIEEQWNIVNKTYSIIEEVGIPFGMSMGNHDSQGGPYGDPYYFANWFNYTRYQGKSYYGGTFAKSSGMDNYFLIDASKPLLFISGEFCSVSDAMFNESIAWASSVIQSNPTRHVIFFNHLFMTPTGTLDDTTYCNTTAQAIWDNALSKYQNVFLILNGHFNAYGKKVFTGNNGNNVTIVTYDPTTLGFGHGAIRIYVFRPDEGKINTAAYLGRNNTFINSLDNIYDYEFNYAFPTFAQSNPAVPTPGGGSPSIDQSTGKPYALNLVLCSDSREYIKRYGQTDFSHLTELNASSVDAMNYIINWQSYCSDALNKTLKEDIVCRKLFYMIISTNNTYTNLDLLNAKQSLSNDIDVSTSILSYYADNYKSSCQAITGLILPFKDRYSNLYSITLFDNVPLCSSSLNSSILGFNMDNSIPFFQIYLGSDLSCSRIDFWRWFVSFDKESTGYYINGIKLWIFILTVFVYLLYSIITSDKVIKSFKRK